MRAYVYFVPLEWLLGVHLPVSAALVFESRAQGQLTCAPPPPGGTSTYSAKEGGG